MLPTVTRTFGSATYTPRSPSPSLNIRIAMREIYTKHIFFGMDTPEAVRFAAKLQASSDMTYVPPGPAREAVKNAYLEINGKPLEESAFDHPVELWHLLGFSDRSQLVPMSTQPYVDYTRKAIQTCEQREGTSFFYLGGFNAATYFKKVVAVDSHESVFGGNFGKFANSVSYGGMLERAGPSFYFSGLELHDYLMGACKDKPFMPMAADGTLVDRETLALSYKEAYTLACSQDNKDYYEKHGELMPAAQAAADKFQALIGRGPKLQAAPTDKVFAPEE